jgi:hypothetical protein
MTTTRLSLAAVAASMLLVLSARAQDKPAAPAPGAPAAGAPAAGAAPSKAQKWVVACDADMKKLCKPEMDAKGDVRPCLAKHETELSEDCKNTFLRQYKAMELCKDDIEKLCKEEAASGGLGKCLIDKKDSLSEKCKGALVKGSKEQKATEAAAAKKEDAPAAGDKTAAKAPAKAGKKKAAKK